MNWTWFMVSLSASRTAYVPSSSSTSNGSEFFALALPTIWSSFRIDCMIVSYESNRLSDCSPDCSWSRRRAAA